MKPLPENSMAQSIQIIALVACWDGLLSNQEAESMLRKIELISGLQNSDWDHSMYKKLTNTFCDTVELALELTESEKNDVIAQAASRITDKDMREATMKLAFQVAGADGLDENEAKLLFDFGADHWGMSSEEIGEAVA